MCVRKKVAYHTPNWTDPCMRVGLPSASEYFQVFEANQIANKIMCRSSEGEDEGNVEDK